MHDVFERMNNVLKHLRVLHEIFVQKENFAEDERIDYEIYKINMDNLMQAMKKLNIYSQLYAKKGRQMMLADFLEYILLGRGYYAMQSKKDKEHFVRLILFFVNMLMIYETLTVSNNLRKKVLDKLKGEIQGIENENYYSILKNFKGKVGLTQKESDAPKELNRYFDSLLPKTAGGLWHELLVYIFLLRNNVGYIIPLLLSQRLISLNGNIIPPDFLIITFDKHIYGVEVGIKKEIKSGSFSLQTNIPTATIDTINSRCSDRCPICKRWILFCDFVIKNYSNFEKNIKSNKVKCIDECDIYSPEQISKGECPYAKYSRHKAKRLEYTDHNYADGYHYHYRCVLNRVSEDIKNKNIEAKDKIAIKTHYPYYSGLEALI